MPERQTSFENIDAARHKTRASSTLTGALLFFVTFLLAALVTYIPIVGVPFKWLESFFHELSHALATLVSGGEVSHITLFPNGAGLCYSAGGSPVLIGFAGYSGAALWGLALYQMASSAKWVRQSFALLGLLVVAAAFLFAKDLLTLSILLVLAGLFLLPLKLAGTSWLTPFLRFIAMIVLLNAIKSPTYLWGLDGQGDADLLADLTWLPAVVWIVLWMMIAAVCLWCCWRSSLRHPHLT